MNTKPLIPDNAGILSSMVLSDGDIRKFLSTGDIVIDPFDEKRLKPASYTLELSSRLLRPLPCKLIEPEDPEVVYETINMDANGYVLNPGEFVLGQVAERLSISLRLCCFLDARTSLARLGLNVLQGSTFIESGQHGSHETLEISNIGPSPIRIYPGLRVAKAIFLLLHSEAVKGYDGKYVAQDDARAK